MNAGNFSKIKEDQMTESDRRLPENIEAALDFAKKYGFYDMEKTRIDRIQADERLAIIKEVSKMESETEAGRHVFDSTYMTIITRMHEGVVAEEHTMEFAVRRFEVSPIIKQCGTWVVTTYGLECLGTYRVIEMYRIHEEGMRLHMIQKAWINENDFDSALFAAQRMYPTEELALAFFKENHDVNALDAVPMSQRAFS